MTTFLRCARHAALPLERRCRGQLDLVPGEDPLVSADQLRLALAAPTPAVVWTSPLRRCSEVAARLAARIGAELRTDPRLLEMDFGEWEGRSWEDIERQDRIAYRDWLAAWRKIAPPRGESLGAFEGRVRSWVQERTRAGEIASCVLIGHAGVIRALSVIGAGARWEDVLAQPVPHLDWLSIPMARAGRP